ncbi:peptide deformylase [Pelagirhabdus alkalitolerans]
MKDVVREGHPSLTKVAKEVKLPATDEDKKLLHDMLEFVKNSQDIDMAEEYDLRPGVGIAAPQLGVEKRMFAVHFEDPKGRLYSGGFFNPKIASHSVEMTYLPSGEGCLSVDRDVPGIVPRYRRITLKATNLEGDEVKFRLKDYAAIVFQHEFDHLNGVMFYDHINEADPFKAPENAKACDLE